MAEFAARLVTPEEVLFDEQVEAVILRTGVGDATFMRRTLPARGLGRPRVWCASCVPGGEEQRVAVHGGFVHVEPEGGVTVLPPSAELAEQIDVERARRSLEAAESKLAELAAAGRTPSDQEGDRHADRRRGRRGRGTKKRAEVRIEVAGA